MTACKSVFHCGKVWLIPSRGPAQEGGGVCMQDRSEGGNDQCILSHWQLLWHLGIYLLQHIFTGLRQHPCCLRGISHSLYGQKQLKIPECERNEVFLYALTHHSSKNVHHLPESFCRCRHFSSQGNWFVYVVPQWTSEACWVSYWQFDTYEAKVNGKCGAINSLSWLACFFGTRSWGLIMRDE